MNPHAEQATEKQMEYLNSLLEQTQKHYARVYAAYPHRLADFTVIIDFWNVVHFDGSLTKRQASLMIDILKNQDPENALNTLLEKNLVSLCGTEAAAYIKALLEA